MLRSELQRKTSAYSDLSMSQLLLQNKIVPVLEHEGLAEYVIRNVGFASLIEFRSKMGFKFNRVEYAEARKEPSHQVLLQETNPERSSIQSLEYQYWVGSNIFITCVLSLQPDKTIKKGAEGIGDSKAKSEKIDRSYKIYVSYDLYAPSENLRQINREKLLFNKQMQTLDQMHFKRKKD